MTRLTIICISFIIVSLMFAGQSYAQIDSENVLGVWLLDEGKGDITEDASGNGNDGTLMSAPAWIAGVSGSALDFSGSSSYVNCGNAEALNVGVFSVSFWCNIPSTQGWNHMISRGQHVASGTPGSVNWGVMMYDAQETILFETFNNTSWTGISADTTTGQWHHVVATYDGDTMQLYHDGVLAASTSGAGILLDQSRPLLIGARSDAGSAGGFFNGSIDEVGYFNTVLTLENIETIMNDGLAGIISDQPLARRPDPKDGAMLEQTWGTLLWSPGDFAVSHDVYIGKNFDDVNNGAANTFQGNHASTMIMVGFAGFPFPDGLVPGTTYYWRIDEVNDTDPNSPWKGEVWSFAIPPRTAYNPDPADGARFVDLEVELGWTAGFNAKLHYVFFGDNFDDVNSAVVGLPQATTTYTPGTIELEKTYYWRVDEFDGFTTHKGDVWSFKTLPDIPITNPNLVGWWKLDEGSGTIVLDRSGHGNHGALKGDPQWVVGYDADALMFDGADDFVEIPHADILTVDSEVTVMAWIYTERHTGPPGQDYQGIVAKGNSVRSYSLYTQAAGTLHFSTTSEGAYVGSSSTAQVPLNEWVHVAAMVANGSHLYYINGEPAGEGGGGITLPGTTDTATVVIGRTHEGSTRSFLGMIDDVRIYNMALTQDDIKQIMRGDPTLAWGPSPANGAIPYIREATPLSWSPGDSVSQHDVYFGTDRDAVTDADSSDTTGVYRGRQGVTFYTPAEGVEWGGGPYYWRVDEYNTDATISKGYIWSFTVADFIVIDDIEDYNDYPPDEIFSTWIDGWEVPTNGSLAGHPDPPFAETGNVHGGRQSMPVYYENNFKYSEATMTLSYPRNWTEEGVGVLSLWFYGDASNAVERMYVALNGSAVVYHNNPNAPLIEEWTQWIIDLQDFAAQGVNLANVNTISIGFGDKNNLRAGGSGMVLFDDIRLYRPPATEPKPAP